MLDNGLQTVYKLGMNRSKITLSLSQEAHKLLESLSEKMGLLRSGVVESLIRDRCERLAEDRLRRESTEGNRP